MPNELKPGKLYTMEGIFEGDDIRNVMRQPLINPIKAFGTPKEWTIGAIHAGDIVMFLEQIPVTQVNPEDIISTCFQIIFNDTVGYVHNVNLREMAEDDE